MPAIPPLSYLIGINPQKLSKKENLFLEAALFISLCDFLKKQFREQYKTYFKLMNFTIEMEKAMLEAHFMQLIIRDILMTGDYNLQGIAYYTNIPEDVICEVAEGRNTNPSALFLQKVLFLHREVRRDLYQTLIKKIIEEEYVEPPIKK